MNEPAWSFRNPVRIQAAPGSLNTLPSLLSGVGDVLLLVSEGFRRRGGVDRVQSLMAGRNVVVLEDIEPNPDLVHVEAQLARLQGMHIGDIVAIGGGSVMDTAKMLAVGLSGASLRKHVFEREPLPPRAVPLICVPTTAGTGSEVTPFATVWDHTTKKKYSVAGEPMFPDVALLDAELTTTMPEDVTISTGLDAITQAFEATWSRRANPVSTAFAIGAIQVGLSALPAVVARPDDIAFRSAMLEASLLAGLAISHARTALCHSISYPITAHFGVPHGFACAMTLPEVFAFNRAADEARFADLAQRIGLESADALHDVLTKLLSDLDLSRRVRRYVNDDSAVIALAPEMLTPGRADNNLREATISDVAQIVASACQRVRG
jgi:phosphonate metabolism-associated iron-containing alcohol dehydrogenase